MAKIGDLPVELLEHIFDDILISTFSPKWHRNVPTPNRALFPFNVASTCILWLSVLKSKSKYWRQVVIDVADDPTAFLDTLSLFKSDGYETARIVIVFSSMKDPDSQASIPHDESIDEKVKVTENTRASAVFERLEGFVADCGSIVFDLVYQSSLPSSARLCTHRLPLLHHLSLTCAIHDCDGVAADLQRKFYPLRSLKSITITGVSFMELCDRGPYRRFPLRQLFSLELSINHFVFKNAEQVKIFQTELASINSYATLSLSNLNFTGVASAQPSSDILLEVGHLVFDSVSVEFLNEFMPAIFHNQSVQILSFQRCVIPDIRLFLDGFENLTETLQLLQLVDIPIDRHSLYNPIYGITPEHVRFLRCGNVTDKLLRNLASFEFVRIKTLELHDCSGFTSNGDRKFVC
ncbi:hypothetical protein HYPSUDRAFT_48183 [Hypholoma sublateritium FD-334 SS-4]|uniref:F-box domain-containing protein n=1 Tax=Hypholoma sublateritium (strain FD-334 SS-4) TaxID=945553 RepID=A0A0D2KM33_HYPSF|nr:hypothetical protein HYPSUDRAFT_48183 [Hypholoma sublateritium FD-334 SS-4]